MRIQVKGRAAKKNLMIFLFVGFALATLWIVKTYFAYRAGHTLTIASLRLAIRLNPGNSTYHVQLGRLYQYSITNPKPAEAVQQFHAAVKANPYSPQAWINLAAAHEFQGDPSRAEKDLRHASALAPRLPIYHVDNRKLFPSPRECAGGISAFEGSAGRVTPLRPHGL